MMMTMMMKYHRVSHKKRNSLSFFGRVVFFLSVSFFGSLSSALSPLSPYLIKIFFLLSFSPLFIIIIFIIFIIFIFIFIFIFIIYLLF